MLNSSLLIYWIVGFVFVDEFLHLIIYPLPLLRFNPFPVVGYVDLLDERSQTLNMT
jgi:hypothetical protein